MRPIEEAIFLDSFSYLYFLDSKKSFSNYFAFTSGSCDTILYIILLFSFCILSASNFLLYELSDLWE